MKTVSDLYAAAVKYRRSKLRLDVAVEREQAAEARWRTAEGRRQKAIIVMQNAKHDLLGATDEA